MKPPARTGLRLINKAVGVSKVEIRVQPGDEVEVSEDVAAQLAAQNLDFVPKDSDAAKRALPYPPPDPEETEATVEEPKPEKARPVKRAAKKRA